MVDGRQAVNMEYRVNDRIGISDDNLPKFRR